MKLEASWRSAAAAVSGQKALETGAFAITANTWLHANIRGVLLKMPRIVPFVA
jgi:hypothetical protein